MNTLILAPAYGRRYPSTEAAEKDFAAGKDFMVLNPEVRGTYASIRDLDRMRGDGYTEVHIFTDSTFQHRTVHVL